MTQVSVEVVTTEGTPVDIRGAYMGAMLAAVGEALAQHQSVEAEIEAVPKARVDGFLKGDSLRLIVNFESSNDRACIAFCLISALGGKLRAMKNQANLAHMSLVIN